MRTAIAFVAVCVFAGGVRAEEFRSDAGHFRFQGPPNWVRFAPAKLAQIKQGIRGTPNTIVHDGFEPAGLRPEFDGSMFPFFFVQEERQPVGRFQTYDGVERSLNNEFRRGVEAGAGANAGANFRLGPITLDRAKNRFSASFDMTAPNGLRIKGMVYGFLGKETVVLMMCFARERDFQRDKPTFDAAADSFRFDDGFQFVPFDVARIGWIILGVVGGACCLLVVVVTVIAVGVMVMMKR